MCNDWRLSITQKVTICKVWVLNGVPLSFTEALIHESGLKLQIWDTYGEYYRTKQSCINLAKKSNTLTHENL